MAQVIAELERSHRGDLDLAARMIGEAKACGADYAKVQAYQTRFLRPGDPAEAALKEAELDERGICFLAQVCKDEGIKFLATVFDPERVPLIRELSDEVKIGSGEQYDEAILNACDESRFGRVFIGAGMTPVAFAHDWRMNTIPMFGVSEYPTHPTLADFAVADALRSWSDDPWGYSDHAPNLLSCDFALGLGAHFVEVHVALGVNKRGAYEKDAEELRILCESAHEKGVYMRVQLEKVRATARARYEGRWSHGR